MADFNSCSSSQRPTTSFTLESEDISTLLHSLLHSSSSLPSNSSFFTPAAAASAPPPIKQVTDDSRCQFVGSVAFSDTAAACFGFPFSGGSYAPEDSEHAGSAFAGAVVSSSAGRDNDFDWESEKDHEASELLRHPTAPAKSSSKRSRPPDVHNLSEKRRRQKINEKMKALQKLIPHSNKTDKASMLDEAIEYLKQLQLQVQMLAMRNGSAVHPFYLSGGMHPTQSTQEGTSFNEGDGVPTCTGQGLNSVMASEDILFTSSYVPLNQGASSSQKEAVLPQQPVAGSKGSGRPVGVELSAVPHCKPFAFHMASKGLLCNDSKLPQLELDMSRFGDDSSSGVSS